MSSDTQPLTHRILLENRSRLTVSGVDGVDRFDENNIILHTCEGTLTVRGDGLHIEKLSLDGGDLLVTGHTDSLTYEEPEEERSGFFTRLFRG